MATTNNFEYMFRNILRIYPISGAIWRMHEAARLAGLTMESPILDLGCGRGTFSSLFFCEPIEVGVDISEQVIDVARTSGIYKDLLVADASKNLPLRTGIFSTIISISVLEHILDMRGVLAEVSRLLKKGGKFILTTNTPRSKTFFLPKVLRRSGLNALAAWYERQYIRQLQIRSVWDKNTWEEELKKLRMRMDVYQEIIPRRSAFWFEMFLPLAFIQGRIPFLTKIPMTRFLFQLINVDVVSETSSGWGIILIATKIV